MNKINLRTRIYLLLAALVFVTIMGGLVMVWYTYRMEGLLTNIISKNMATLYVAEGLEIALVNQKGFVSYYFLDGDPDWLRQLGEYRQIFKERLEKTKALANTELQKQTISRIEANTNTDCVTTEKAVAEWVHEALTAKGTENLFESCMDTFATMLISEALNLTDGNRSRAAKLLGLSRPTLHSKIDKFGLKIETSVSNIPPKKAVQ